MLLFQVNYPVESFFYPYHLIIALVTSAIFLIIVLSYRSYLIRQAEKTAEKSHNAKHHSTQITKDLEKQPAPPSPKADAIAIGTLVLSIVVTGILPLLQSPLLDYSASPQENDTKLSIEINNLGLATANNIISSISAKNVTFTNFESEPFLANHFTANGSMFGKGYFEISTMAPRSEITVNATLDTSKADKKEQLKVYLTSDERVGFHDTLITSIFYGGLGIAYLALFFYLVYSKYMKVTNLEEGPIKLKWKRLEDFSICKIVGFVLIIVVAEIGITFTYYLIFLYLRL